MNYLIKLAIGSLVAWVAIAAANAEDPNQFKPSHDLQSYDENRDEDQIFKFFITKWDSLGYQMPKTGDIFRWDDYLAPVPGGKPRMYDLCMFHGNNGQDMEGLYMGSGQGVVVLECPAPDGLSILLPVEEKQIVGYLRPKVRKPVPRTEA